VDRDLFLVPWDSFSSEQRRIAALQWDYQHDPATELERQHAWDRHVRTEKIKEKIQEWEQVKTPAASDLELKEARLRHLHAELSLLQVEVRDAKNRLGFSSVPKKSPGETGANKKFIPYLVAQERLEESIRATPHELAIWVWLGPAEGGLAAYLNAQGMKSPPRFFYDHPDPSGQDYLAPLMACWFREKDIEKFEPKDRYITGENLIARWSKHPAIRPEAYIRAKIDERRLLDLHPTFGGTQATFPTEKHFPPIEAGLYALSEIIEIEASEFSDEAKLGSGEASTKIGTEEWRKRNARAAANTLHNLPGGSREKHKKIQEAWATGKYDSRDRCAEEESRSLGMSLGAARRALINTPEPDRG
jgi:hypothetical protein